MPAFRLGFLLCDHAIDSLAERYGDYPQMFAAAFGAINPAIAWTVYDVTAGELPARADEQDGWLISGSRHGAYDELPWIDKLQDFIRAVRAGDTPMVGLCFGHQIIGQALGGEVRQSDRGWGIGIHDYTVNASRDWMQPPLAAFTVPVCHQDQVLVMPANAVRLASNAHCENFVVEFAPHILGIQGHPEFSPDFIAALIDWRQDRLPATTSAQARASVSNPHDNTALKTWICRFLRIPVGDA